MAPEIFKSRGYGFPCDWWALGCLCYEMIIGFTPFLMNKPVDYPVQKLIKIINNDEISWPSPKKHGISVSDEAKDFITKCLSKYPELRLGTKNGLHEVLTHPWF